MTLALEPTSHLAEPKYHKVVRDLTAANSPVEFDGDLAIEGAIGPGVLLRAAGTVTVSRDIDAATIVCGGELTVEAGAIVGGRVVAGKGLTCRQLGEARGTATQVVIGIDEFALETIDRRILEVDAARQKAETFLKKLAPMLQQAKQLSAGQKEQLTELLSQGQEAQQRAASAKETLRLRVTALIESDLPICTISGELFAGVMFIFPGGACEVRSAGKGPFQIQATKMNQTRTLQTRHLHSGKLQPLQPVSQTCRIAELLKRLS